MTRQIKCEQSLVYEVEMYRDEEAEVGLLQMERQRAVDGKNR